MALRLALLNSGRLAPKLQHLSFSFRTHELHRMENTGISEKFPSTFPLLKSLYIDCSGAHGDDGSSIEKLLHGLPNLRVLHIDAPNCDLENCRIKGLTWTYRFPRLTHFALSIYYDSAQDIASFLANHPTIRTLMFDADGDEPIPNVCSLLPDLEALSVEELGYSTLFGDTELLSTNPLQNITYFKTESFPDDQHLIPQPSLRCLELLLSIEDIRNEQSKNSAYHRNKALLALLPELSELAIRFSSGWTTLCIADGISRKALPMDEEILSKIIAALPTSSNLQVLEDHDDGKGSRLTIIGRI